MQLIDQERAALVEELNSRARTMFDTATGDLLDSAEWTKSDRYDFYTMLADQLTEEAVEMFEKHLADRAATVAEPDAETVDRVAKAIHRRGPASGQDFRYRPETEQEMYRDMARAALAAMPSCRDAEWLDDALDSVHPETYVSYVLWESGSQGSWRACIRWPDSRMSARWGYPHLDSIGHGTTRREAILDAVQKAKEASDE